MNQPVTSTVRLTLDLQVDLDAGTYEYRRNWEPKFHKPEVTKRKRSSLRSAGLRRVCQKPTERQKKVCAVLGVSLFIWDLSTSMWSWPDNCGTAGRASCSLSISLHITADSKSAFYRQKLIWRGWSRPLFLLPWSINSCCWRPAMKPQ